MSKIESASTGIPLRFSMSASQHHLVILFVCLFLASSVVLGSSYSSRNSSEKLGNGDPLVFQFDGFYVAVYSALDIYLVQGSWPDSQPIVGNMYFALHFLYIVERGFGTPQVCNVPNGNPSAFGIEQDPLSNDTTQFAPMYSYINMTNLPFTTRAVSEIPLLGVNLTHFIFEATDPVTGTFVQTNFSVISGGNYSYLYSNDTTYAQGETFYIQYRTNVVKLSNRVLNYPWTYRDNVFLVMPCVFELGFVTNMSTSYSRSGITETLNLTAPNGQTLIYDLEPFYAQDGVPFFQANNWEQSFSPALNPFIFTVPVVISFCSGNYPNNAYTELFWDPEFTGIGALFAPPVSPPGSPPNSPNSPTAKAQVGLIIGVTIAVVVIVAVVAAIALLFAFHPPFKAFLLGYSKSAKHMSSLK